MKLRMILTIAMGVTTLLCLAADPVVSNVRAAQRPGTPYVHITYDLADADTETLDVSVSISTNGGATYFTPAAALSGQLGSVARGTRRAVVWNAGATLPPKLFSNVCVQVTASDIPSDYMVIDLSGGTGASSYPVTYYASSNDVPGGVNSDGYKTTNLLMRLIPAGVFTMGGRSNDFPGASDDGLHQVTLTKSFYMGVFEVTQRQWELVMGNKPSYFNNASCYASRPVEQVRYYDIRENPAVFSSDDGAVDWPANSAVNATSFMGKLRTKTGLTTFDLPTESQWEYACRAGTTTALNSGKNLTNTEADANMAEVGRYSYNGGSGYMEDGDTMVGTAKVGSYLPNAWGLYDMHGNVTEWCLDWYGAYSGAVSDPLGAASGVGRVDRGGNFYNLARNCRSASRSVFHPSRSSCAVGFRAARTVELAPSCAPTLIQQPQAVTNCPGSTVIFSVRVTGTEPFGFQWRKGGTNLIDAGSLSGSSSTNLCITSLVLADAGNYDVVVSNAFGCATSQVAVLTVMTVPAYMVIDLSGGTGASSYPVTYYASSNAVPGGVNSDAYKTTNLLMRLIPAGVFTMGGRSTDYPGAYDEGLHQVTLAKSFYMGVFEVTQRQWELVMGNKPSYFSNVSYYASRPVENVSYYEIREKPANSNDAAVDWPNNSAVNATSFMGKLRAKTGLSTFDLPTEAQWEYACRAGTTTALNSGKNLARMESDSNMAEVGRYCYNGGSGSTQNGNTTVGTAKVGSYLPNGWGLYDMHGNVWEWCLDWYGAFSGTVSDPLGAASGPFRVARGGSCYSSAIFCYSAYRSNFNYPYYRSLGMGFRAARTVESALSCAPTLIQQPQAVTNYLGSTVTFSVDVTGAEPFGFQWRKGGTNLIDAGSLSGSSSTNLCITSLVLADAGNYDVVVSNAFGCATSHVAVLTVLTVPSVPTNGDYLVIDLSGGTSASRYPVTYITNVPGGGWTDEYKTTKLVMRRISAGSFSMGSPLNELGRWDDEAQHTVTLTKDFYIGVFEVTQRQWELVMGNRPSCFSNATCYASRPVEKVSYYEIRENPAGSDDPAVNWPNNSAVSATSFMGKLRAKTGLTTFDLPTESQWEYACRAGTTTALNSGQNLNNASSDANMAEVGRYWFNGGSGYTRNGDTTVGTAKVGSYRPNSWGLYDMHGNVSEWCLDWWDTYPGAVSDPKGAVSGWDRVLRGGDWATSSASSCRSAYRDYFSTPDLQDLDMGFRAAWTMP